LTATCNDIVMFGDCRVNFVLVSGSKTVDEGCVMPYLNIFLERALRAKGQC